VDQMGAPNPAASPNIPPFNQDWPGGRKKRCPSKKTGKKQTQVAGKGSKEVFVFLRGHFLHELGGFNGKGKGIA